MKDITSLLHLVSLTLLLFCSPALAQNIPDFLVNDHASIDGSEQSIPDIDGYGNNNYVLTWMDARNGSKFNVYAQIYRNGTPFGENFKVADEGETATKYNPAIAVGPSLNFVITWLDKRNGFEWDVYAQRFLNDGTTLGNNFKVNTEPGNEEQEHPCVAIDDFGNFTIVWADEKSGDWDIWGQGYSAEGMALGDNFKISDDTGNELQYWPCCSCDKNGNLVVAWVDRRYYDDYNIYAQQYLPDGTALGDNFRVNTDTEYSFQLRPDISFVDNGNFIIAWEDQRNGDWDVYAQRYLSDGTNLGDNFKINDNIPNTSQRKISTSSDMVGNFVVSWEDDRDDYKDVFAQRFTNEATPLGDNFKVNTDTTNTYQFYSEIACDNTGNFMIAWEDHHLGVNGDIFTQTYESDGTPVGENIKANDDVGSENQTYPAIAVDGSENSIVCWIDHRDGYQDIYAQRCSGNGMALGNNFKVNDDTADYINHYSPSVATDDAGNFVIAWEDYRSYNVGNIYAQRYASDGTPLGNNFMVNTMGSNMNYSPKIVYGPDGGFVIAWSDAEDGAFDNNQNLELDDEKKYCPGLDKKPKGTEPDIYAQRYSADGTPLGGNLKVNDDIGATAYQQHPAIAINDGGEFIITWEDNRNGDWDIYYQRYGYDGTPIDGNHLVQSMVMSEFQNNPCVTYIWDDIFIIAWADKRNGNYDIFLQYYHLGTSTGFDYLVNTDGGDSYQGSPCISSADNRVVINWRDLRNGNEDIYGQRFYAEVNEPVPYLNNYSVSDNDDFTQINPAVTTLNYSIFNVWQDNHSQNSGYDIWANITNWYHWVGVNEHPIRNTNESIVLHQNSPNPFTSSTTIKFDLPGPAKVKIEIFNHFGQKKETMLNKTMSSGSHEINFLALNLLEGVYYYSLVARPLENQNTFRQVKKMVVMR